VGKESKMWCPYLGKESNEKFILDHIIPKSLGGHNQFVLSVSENGNSEMQQKAERPYHDLFLVSHAKMKRPWQGHHKIKERFSKWKDCQTDEGKADVFFGKESLCGKPPVPIQPLTPISFKATIDFDIAIRFFAKIILGGSYFLYGRKTEDIGLGCYLRKLIAEPSPSHYIKKEIMSGSHESFLFVTHIGIPFPPQWLQMRADLARLSKVTERHTLCSIIYDDGIEFCCGIDGLSQAVLRHRFATSKFDVMLDLGETIEIGTATKKYFKKTPTRQFLEERRNIVAPVVQTVFDVVLR